MVNVEKRTYEQRCKILTLPGANFWITIQSDWGVQNRDRDTTDIQKEKAAASQVVKMLPW